MTDESIAEGGLIDPDQVQVRVFKVGGWMSKDKFRYAWIPKRQTRPLPSMCVSRWYPSRRAAERAGWKAYLAGKDVITERLMPSEPYTPSPYDSAYLLH